jgi:hypothetical protein
MFALVIVLSLLLREIRGAVCQAFPPTGRSWVRCKLLRDARARDGRISLHHHPRRAPDRRFFGGTGSFEESALLVIWLQFILICVQVIQIATLFVLPPLAGLITIIAIALYLWLLVNFIAVLHGFTSLGMVFVATLLSAFALLFVFSLILSVLGLGVAPA